MLHRFKSYDISANTKVAKKGFILMVCTLIKKHESKICCIKKCLRSLAFVRVGSISRNYECQP